MSRTQGILQDIANTLPQMAMSERVGNADLEILTGLPDGRLELDLLAREVRHSSGAAIRLAIVTHLAEWLAQRLQQPPETMLRRVALVVTLRTDRVPTDRRRVVPFDWRCDAIVESHDHVVVSGHGYGLTWYDRDRVAQ